MITLTKFTDASDANYTKALLEENKIECLLKFDDSLQHAGEIELVLIHDHDLEQAEDIIADDTENSEL
jgi:hypothetical protein